MLDSLQNGRCSLSYLCIQPPLQSPPIIRSFTSVNFRLDITSLQSPRTLPSSIPQQFFISIFAYNHPSNLHQKFDIYYKVCRILYRVVVAHYPTCAYNHTFNLHQKFARLLQPIFVSILHP